MTDTIGWGEVDEQPRRRLPGFRLNRRRRTALVVVAALVAGAVVAWPSFRSWRADEAARQVQRIWAQAQGFDNSRIVDLAGVQSTLGVLDTASFAAAVAEVDAEEAADLDRLARQANAIRTWSSDVAAARRAVVKALSSQAAGLRIQARDRSTITFDYPLTTSVDGDASTAADIASGKVEALAARRHLKSLPPTREPYPAAAAALARLHRPTDDLLHLQLVTASNGGVTVTDLDTGRVVLTRTIDITDAANWQPQRLLGKSVVGSSDAGVVIVPLTANGHEKVVAGASIQSSSGSPMWLSYGDRNVVGTVDQAGRTSSSLLNVPVNTSFTGLGTGSLLLLTDAVTVLDSLGNPGVSHYYAVRPPRWHPTPLAIPGCPQQPTLDGRIIVVTTGPHCGDSGELDVYDLAGRHLRTAKVPYGNVSSPAVASPDGTVVALTTASSSAGSFDPTQPSTVRLLDTRTGSWTTVTGAGDWLPTHWSSDGTTLLLQATNAFGNPGPAYGQLAYVRVGDPTLHSIRLAADLASFLS